MNIEIERYKYKICPECEYKEGCVHPYDFDISNKRRKGYNIKENSITLFGKYDGIVTYCYKCKIGYNYFKNFNKNKENINKFKRLQECIFIREKFKKNEDMFLMAEMHFWYFP